MHSLPSISSCSSTPELSLGSALEDRIAHARLGPVNYDDTRCIRDFKESSDFDAAVDQTLLGLHWLEDLLGANPRWATIRAAFHPFVVAFSGDTPAHVEAQCRFLGQGKRCLYELCELLQGDPLPSTRERVVRALERDLTNLDGTLPDPGDVLDRALEAARDPSRDGHRPPTPTAPPMSLSPPPSRRVAASASVAPQSIAPQRSLLEQARQQAYFYGDVDQTPEAFRAGLSYDPARRELFLLLQWLKSLLPEKGPDQDVGRMIGQRAQAWVGDEDNFNDERAQLFGAGKHLCLSLCQALESDSSDKTQAIACEHLRAAFQAEQPHRGAITALGRALSEVIAAGTPDGAERRRAQARTALEAWARERRFGETPRTVATAFLEYLGFDESPDVVVDNGFHAAGLGAQVCCAAQRASAAVSQDSPERSVLVDRLLDGVERLRQCGRRSQVDLEPALNRLVERFIDTSPTGGAARRGGQPVQLRAGRPGAAV